MNQLSSLLLRLAGRWGSSLAGWALVSTLIWYVAPLVPMLRSPGPRLVLMAASLAACLGVNAVMSWRARRREQALASAISGEVDRDFRESAGDAAAEVAELRERMRAALARLRRGRRGNHLYDQPWYVLIGPPGSGKTTAVRNSGFYFPLADAEQAGPVSGVGGTRLCDWWFADEAVLIDTAGRYTTQDSDAVVDRAGWQGFLDLLRRARPRQPINGVVVVLSITALATSDAAERVGHAVAVRRRIDELTERLQLRVPVYVMLSKADQLHGFDAYFDDLGAAGRGQVWGLTLSPDDSVAAFPREFRLLLDRLTARMIERLQAERAADRRALIGGFPLQVASLQEPLTEFLNRAFSGSRLDPAPLLRGVYLTSATQQGTPIDRLAGLLARTFGVDQNRIASLRPVSGRAYFVSRLLKEMILGEALLASRPPRLQRRRRVARLAGFSAIGIATLLAASLLWRVSAANRQLVEQADERLASYRQVLAQTKLDPVADDSLPEVDHLLQEAAAVPLQDGSGAGVEALPLLGLSQIGKLRQAEQQIYEQALQRIFLPRLIWRLEHDMRARIADPEALYEATRVYLMLGGAGPLTPGLVRGWMAADWAARFPGTLNAGLRERLEGYLTALLARPLPPTTLDGPLVESARSVFSRVSLAARVYGRLRSESGAQADERMVPDWIPAAALGSAGSQMFTRRSGASLSDGVAGFYTGDGFRRMLVVELPLTARAVAEESWVLGHTDEIPDAGPQLASLEEAVLALYAADAQAHWDSLLADLGIALPAGRDAAIEDLYILSSPQSPLRDLLMAIARALRMQSAAVAGDAGGAAAANRVADAAADAVAATSPAMRQFKAHFQPLFDLVGNGGQAPLDNILHLLSALQQELAALGPGTLSATLQGSGAPVALLRAEASRQPAPIARFLAQTASAGDALLGSATQAAASAAYGGDKGPRDLCRSVVDGKFPFDPQSGSDAPIDDFAHLFGPGGVLDTYFQSQIKPFVDTSSAAWRPQSLGGVAAPVDVATVAQFQRAAAIRDAFFPAGGAPLIRFSLAAVPGSADQKATLTVGAASISSDESQPIQLSWPGADGSSVATLRFGPAGQPADITASDAWAIFRLIARGRLLPDGEAERLAFDTGEHHASFLLQPGSSRNPFARNLLRGFHCPIVR